ncbi:hypothetical protein [Salinibaculum rarum]|uniref:hypothetical protein n=1 Tax=Salinibaculum rarum TaxID=3058903 RepID=UPI00265F34C9|nr:hypothetical protein [Salinibaculum sp. KK48]
MNERKQSSMYELSYEFDGSGGNIQYQTEQQVKTEATAAAVDVEVVSTGLSLRAETIHGIAMVEIADDIDPDAIFESAARVRDADLLIDPVDAPERTERGPIAGENHAYRFEVSKVPLVVGAATHGPGQTDAVFCSADGEAIRSHELASRQEHEDLDVSFHPLGVIVEGELYRPVRPNASAADGPAVGEPIEVATYRGSDGKPWQFGITRYDGQLLITQARAGPEKFDPVLKRFPIERRTIGDEPLVFSHTVSRRVWSEDPVNLHVQSQRSEGLRTQILYADTDGWHLIQPTDFGDPSEAADGSFEPTQLNGVAVRSALLRSETDGETKATVEHEYRITTEVFDACDRLYALSYHEANEESFDRLQWDIADASAYEIVRDQSEH